MLKCFLKTNKKQRGHFEKFTDEDKNLVQLTLLDPLHTLLRVNERRLGLAQVFLYDLLPLLDDLHKI